MATIDERLFDLQKIQGSTSLAGRDFLETWRFSLEEIQQTLLVAEILKAMYDQNISPRVFDSRLAVSEFRDNSTRTRYSFNAAANLLGLTVEPLDEAKSQKKHGETIRETVNMLAFLTQFFGIRDDKYIGEGHKYMEEVGEALTTGAREGVFQTRPGVINLQSDIDHSTQAMADLAHLVQHYGSLDKLRGKKIAMSWAHSPSYGKPLSVPQGIIGLLTRFGMDVVLAHPEGYNLIQDVVDRAGRQARDSSGNFTVVHDMAEAFNGADIVYPKSWAPYDVMVRRTQLLKAGDTKGLERLERECLAQNAGHKDWECTQAMMERTLHGSALYMHCLPADITGVSCEAGEVARDVFERSRVATYKEAGWKPFIIAAIMLNYTYGKDAGRVLQQLYERGKPLIWTP